MKIELIISKIKIGDDTFVKVEPDEPEPEPEPIPGPTPTPTPTTPHQIKWKGRKITTTPRGTPIYENPLELAKDLSLNEVQLAKKFREFPIYKSLTDNTLKTYAYDYRRYLRGDDKPKQTKRKSRLGPIIAKGQEIGIRTKPLKFYRETNDWESTRKEFFPNAKKRTTRKYQRDYDEYIKTHPTPNEIGKKREEKKFHSQVFLGPVVGELGHNKIYKHPLQEIRKHPSRINKILKKYYPNTKPSSRNVYRSAYRRWIDLESNDLDPETAKKVKARMVTMWREGREITHNALSKEFPEIPYKELTRVLKALKDRGEIKIENGKINVIFNHRKK